MSDATLQMESLGGRDEPAERLRSLWTRGERPDVRAFLEGEPELDVFELVDVLRVDQRFRWLLGEPIHAADYFPMFPALRDHSEAQFMLVYAEYLLREDLGDMPDPAEYEREYPEHVERLRTQLEVHRLVESGGTTLVAPAPGIGSPQRGVPSAPEVPGFEVLEFLGQGGMGVVFKARDVRLGRIVALKMFHPGAHVGPKEVARFRVEAEMIARLQHPNIVQIHNVVDLNGRPCLELEYVGGGNLAHRISQATLSPTDTALLVETAARAIGAAHRIGVIHRDLKPANILLTSEGVPKLSDFGLAKYLHAETGLTQSEALLGSPCYMAPEQADGALGEVGPAADVYALGVVLYEAITGRPPFKAATVYATLAQVKTATPVPPSRLQPGLGVDLETVILRCLQKEPSQRYASADALADDLARVACGEPVHARRVSSIERGWRWCCRKPALAGLAATVLFLLGVLAVGGWIAFVVVAFERDRVVSAERQAVEELRQSYVLQARANRLTGRAGQRFASLRTLAAAARIRPSPELRDEIVACLALDDLQVGRRWPGNPSLAFPVDFTPDLQHYILGTVESPLVIRATADESLVARVNVPPGAECQRCLFSPDGSLLAVSYHVRRSSGRFVVYDAKTGREIYQRERGGVWGDCCFTSDGHGLVMALEDGTVRVVELDTGHESGRAWGLTSEPSWLGLSPDGRLLAVASLSETDVTLYRLDSGEVERRLTHPQRVRVLAWSHDGTRLVTGCDDRRAYLWDIVRGRGPIPLEAHKSEVIKVGFNASDSQVFSAGWDDLTRLFDARSGEELVAATGQGVRFGGDDRLAFREADEHLGIWNVLTNSAFRVMRGEYVEATTPRLVVDGNRGVEFSPDGRYLAGAGADAARVWEVSSGRELAVVPSGRVAAVTFTPNSRGLITYGIRGLFAWPFDGDPDEAGRLRVGPPRDLHGPIHRSRMHRLCWLSDGKTLAVNDPWPPGRIVLIDHETAEPRGEYRGHRWLYGVAFSPDRGLLAVGSRGESGARVWDARTRKTVRRLPGSRKNAEGAEVAFSPDGRWLATGNQGEYRFYEVGTWKAGPVVPRDRLVGMPGPVAYSPTGRLVAIAPTQFHVKLIDAQTFQPITSLIAPDGGEIRELRFSPDGLLLAVATESIELTVWDLTTIRNELARLGVDWSGPPSGSFGP